MRSRRWVLPAVAVALLGACSSDSDDSSAGDLVGEVTAEGISNERCEANRAAGTITYLSGFDFAASPSIVDVVVAEANGYFDTMCLDVELKPSDATKNYPLVAAGRAQFASGGSYSELLSYTGERAEFVVTANYGKAPIEALVTPSGGVTTLEDLRGKLIGIKGDIPPSIVAMLAEAGLERGADYDEIVIEGFDPVAHLALDVDALPVYKSNEPGQLDAAGIEYTLFDPVSTDIPGSFGLLYTSAEFAAQHPTAVVDFTRAALRGMEDVIADPAAAVAASVTAIDVAGNQYFLTEQGELFRLNAEIDVMRTSTPAEQPLGLIDPDLFANEYKIYVDAGVWPDGAPEDGNYYDETIARTLYDAGGSVIWPAT